MNVRIAIVAVVACGGAAPKGEVPLEAMIPPRSPPLPCTLAGPPVVVRSEGAGILERWEVEDGGVLFEPVMPNDAAFEAFQRAIAEAGADLERPIADPPVPRDDAEREMWRREDQNLDVAYSGRGGTIRPIRCLEAFFFARQHARYSELTQPTEFLVAVVEKPAGNQRRLRIYFAASDVMFPPKAFYPFPDVKQDVADGWRFTIMLHNHTIRTRDGKPALWSDRPERARCPSLAQPRRRSRLAERVGHERPQHDRDPGERVRPLHGPLRCAANPRHAHRWCVGIVRRS